MRDQEAQQLFDDKINAEAQDVINQLKEKEEADCE